MGYLIFTGEGPNATILVARSLEQAAQRARALRSGGGRVVVRDEVGAIVDDGLLETIANGGPPDRRPEADGKADDQTAN